MVKGKQILALNSAPITAADIAASPVGTLGDFLKGVLTGTEKTITFPAIVAAGVGQKASNSALTEVPKTMPKVNVGGADQASVGDGTKAGVAFYFSTDGTAAKSLATLAIGDLLYVNTTGASGLGYSLDAADTLYLSYRA